MIISETNVLSFKQYKQFLIYEKFHTSLTFSGTTKETGAKMNLGSMSWASVI